MLRGDEVDAFHSSRDKVAFDDSDDHGDEDGVEDVLGVADESESGEGGDTDGDEDDFDDEGVGGNPARGEDNGDGDDGDGDEDSDEDPETWGRVRPPPSHPQRTMMRRCRPIAFPPGPLVRPNWLLL